MLNGDVLTDLDLGRPDRPARDDRAQPARWRSCRSPTRRATASCACAATASVEEFLEKPSPDTVARHEPHLRGRLRPRALRARPHRGRREGLDRARGLARARRQGPVRLRRRRARTGSTSGRRSATCRRPSTSSRATCARPSPTGSGRATFTSIRRPMSKGRAVPPAVIGAGAPRSPRARMSAAWRFSART